MIASLWQVSDVATAELMKKFYAGMLQRRLCRRRRPAAGAARDGARPALVLSVLLGRLRPAGRLA